MRESFPYNDTTIIMDFIYDEAGRPFCVSYSKNGGESYTNYFYAVNAQGDVEGIFRVIKNDETGKYEQKWYGRYVYDAWGNVTATTAAGGNPSATSLVVRNPIRYRGYYYDTETGWYYVQSRYYDPVTHRFLNADSYASTGQGIIGTNMFAYCNNNPVNCADDTGKRTNMLFAVFYDKDSSESNTGDGYIDPNQVPNPESGYVAPKKNPNPRKVRNPNGAGYGWPASDGGVWIPDNNMDGGPGWVVQYPDGHHEHRYPDGHRRVHKAEKINWSKVSRCVGDGLLTAAVVLDIVVLVVDNIIPVGTADDAYIEQLAEYLK